MIRVAAAELPQVDLADALSICLAMSAQDDERYDRAATRWLARLVCERPALGLDDLHTALTALQALAHDPDAAKRVLRDVCRTHRLEHVVGLLL
jgi:hypothetical protein